MDTVEAVAHPVRLRIVHALSGGRALTTAQLCDRLPGVSKASVYRHVAILAKAGLLELESEQQIRGTVERTYRLHVQRATIDPERAAAATPDEHRAMFTVAMTTLLAEYNAYLDHEQSDPAADMVGYRQHAIWLTDTERDTMIEALRAAIIPPLTNKATPERSQYLLSPILFPLTNPED
jgi:DNA-binding transcriptional ArsR family regulator